MTDPKDYTMLPEVLKACGLRLQKYTDPDENYWTDGKGHCRGKNPVLTFPELWEGLCRVCGGTGYFPGLNRNEASVVWQEGLSNFTYSKYFPLSTYGSFENAVAAALHWVLQRGGGGESGEFFEE